MNKTFGEKLKEARTDRKLKQAELAKQLGVTNTTISNWEKNISKPDLDMLSYICGALNVKVSYFLEAKLPEDQVSIPEFNIIKKYRDLDDHGKEMVNFVLDREYERIKKTQEDTPDTEIAPTGYELLNQQGKRKVMNFTLDLAGDSRYNKNLTNDQQIVAESELLSDIFLNAANPRTDIDVTTEHIESDNDLMGNPNEWK